MNVLKEHIFIYNNISNELFTSIGVTGTLAIHILKPSYYHEGMHFHITRFPLESCRSRNWYKKTPQNY